MTAYDSFSDVPLPLQIALVALVAVQLFLLIAALFKWARTSSEDFRNLPRELWLVIIFVGGIIGSSVFLLTGTKPPAVHDAGRTGRRDVRSIQDTIDELYGPDTDSDAR